MRGTLALTFDKHRLIICAHIRMLQCFWQQGQDLLDPSPTPGTEQAADQFDPREGARPCWAPHQATY
ncbi:hypothetical protein GCM10009839_10130 [Catenulispora yoronensis]|uniref:Uncharacterized protein n=1 Tax=Catenulispora yoronensis TaxID=450799 RepID=A0ABN2TQT7_9ACTN